MVHIGIDLMGSDASPKVFLEALIKVANEMSNEVEFTLFGTKQMEKHFQKAVSVTKNLHYHPVKSSIFMHENPLFAVRRKKKSSMIEGMRMLHKKQIDAFISTGNTGALMTSAKMILKTLPGVIRPALLTLMPTKKNLFVVLDVGANVSCKSEFFVNFALMGMALQKIRGIEKPNIGLLNIGSEAKKGTSDLQKTFKHLKRIRNRIKDEFSFHGNVEGKDIFEGNIDVLITDGFTGNVFLKTAEGLGSFILDSIQEHAKSISKELQENLLKEMHQHLHYGKYPGALLIGANGLVVKCHGNSSALALENAIKGAIQLVKFKLIDKLKNTLESYQDVWV